MPVPRVHETGFLPGVTGENNNQSVGRQETMLHNAEALTFK